MARCTRSLGASERHYEVTASWGPRIDEQGYEVVVVVVVVEDSEGVYRIRTLDGYGSFEQTHTSRLVSTKE